MNKIALISGCDANYFPMLMEWIYSVRQHKQCDDMDICILDAGLTDAQREILKPHVQAIHNPDWPCDIPKHKIRGREFLKACVCRPFIPKMFPGYETYFWMDADTWVQNYSGMDLFLRGAAKGKIALTGQVDRAYPRAIRVKWLGTWPWKVRGFYFSNARRAFGFKAAKYLLPYHVLLAGAFALRADAPHWDHWQKLVLKALKKGKIFTAEQLCLGVMCYLDGYEFEILPGWSHWLCEFKPLWDKKSEQFVEPFLPHEPLGILHMSGFDEMRLDRSITTEFKTTDGDIIQRHYRFGGYDGETEKVDGKHFIAS